MSIEWTDRDLAELLSLVRGEGKWAFLGGGLWTHPQSDDANNQRIQAGMELLEQRGQVRRKQVEPSGSVIWVAVKDDERE